MSRRAQTMLELVAAIVIVGAAIASLSESMHRQFKESEQGREMHIAMLLAREEVDYLRVMGYVAIDNQLNANPWMADTTSGTNGSVGGYVLNPALLKADPTAPNGYTFPSYDPQSSNEALFTTRFQRRVEFLWDPPTVASGPCGWTRRVCRDPAAPNQPSYCIRVRITISTNGGMTTGVPSTAHQVVTYIGAKNCNF